MTARLESTRVDELVHLKCTFRRRCQHCLHDAAGVLAATRTPGACLTEPPESTVLCDATEVGHLVVHVELTALCCEPTDGNPR